MKTNESKTPRTEKIFDLDLNKQESAFIELARQLELELTAAQQTIRELQQREARLREFIADTERRAEQFMLPTPYGCFMKEQKQLKAKKLSTTPAETNQQFNCPPRCGTCGMLHYTNQKCEPAETMVPWSVVKGYVNAEAWADSFSHCGGCEIQKSAAFERLETARKQLQSYAPKEKGQP